MIREFFKKLFFIFIFLSQVLLKTLYSADVLDCPKEPIRLDKKYNLLVQDQDGLGTCFANSASLLLQSLDLKNRPVSYIYLASIVKPEASNFYSIGGNVCNVIKEVKKSGACPKEFSKLENNKVLLSNSQEEFSPNLQEEVLRELHYYWYFLSNLKNDSKNSSDIEIIKQNQPKLVELYREAKKQYELKDINKSYNNLENLIVEKINSSLEIKSDEEKLKLIQKTHALFDLNYILDLKSDRELDIEFYLKNIFSQNQNLKENFLAQNQEQLLEAYKKDKKNYLAQYLDLYYETELKKYFYEIKNQKACIQQDSYLKLYSENIAKIINIYEIMKTNLDDYEDFLKVSLAKNPNELVVGALMPECLNENNLYKYENNFDCKVVDLPIERKAKNESTHDYYKKNQVSARNVILKSLLDTQKPMPVSLTICSAVLKDATVFTNFNYNEDECQKAKGVSHLVTIVGARKNTKTNKCEFLVQNSWGSKNCETTLKKRYDTENEKLPEKQKKVVDCEENGNVWIPEDELLNNASAISKITFKEK